jgi:hypothetical protein
LKKLPPKIKFINRVKPILQQQIELLPPARYLSRRGFKSAKKGQILVNQKKMVELVVSLLILVEPYSRSNIMFCSESNPFVMLCSVRGLS